MCKRAGVVAALALIAACTSPTDDVLVVDYDSEVGTYQLVLGSALEWDAWRYIRSGSLTLHENGTFVDRLTTQSNGSKGYESVHTGFYTRLDGRVVLRYSDERPPEIDTLAATPRELVKLTCEGGVRCIPGAFRYRR